MNDYNRLPTVRQRLGRMNTATTFTMVGFQREVLDCINEQLEWEPSVLSAKTKGQIFFTNIRVLMRGHNQGAQPKIA